MLTRGEAHMGTEGYINRDTHTISSFSFHVSLSIPLSSQLLSSVSVSFIFSDGEGSCRKELRCGGRRTIAAAPPHRKKMSPFFKKNSLFLFYSLPSTHFQQL
jgi:hypothetical protein